jgi:hypothetical protein
MYGLSYRWRFVKNTKTDYSLNNEQNFRTKGLTDVDIEVPFLQWHFNLFTTSFPA